MKLTAENYFSQEANQAYLSVSQYKDFVGTYGMRGCEAMALAKVRGEWEEDATNAMLVGSFVDAHFEGTLDVFKAQHPNIFTKAGDLRSEYCGALDVIKRIERDPYFMQYLAGEKQVIFTAEIYGIPWKIKIDSLIRDVAIVDLKVMKSLRESHWVKDLGHVSFVEYWGYDIQGAVYQKVVELNTGKRLPFFLAAASKEEYPDIEIIGFTQQELDGVMNGVFTNIARINDIKQGRVTPDRCEQCDYCRATKVLSHPVHFSELILKV